MKLKKVISLVLVVVMMLGCIGFVACGEGEGETTPPSNGETTPPSDGETVTITEAGLVAYYSFDGDTQDYSKNSNHAENHGAAFVSGHSGKALSFDGETDFVQAPVNINPIVMPQMTMAAWVKPDDGSPIRQIISHDNSGYDRAMGIDKRGGGTGWSAFCGSGAVLGYHPVAVGEWAFIAAAYDQDAGTVILYVDGATYEKEGKIVGGGREYIMIGSSGSPEFPVECFSGVIDEVKIYNYALSNKELSSLRETGSTGTSATSEPADGKTTGDETLDKILARGADLPSIKYDQVFTSPGEPTVTWKVWMEGKKARIEMSAEGQTVIMLMDFDTSIMYMYLPAENKAMRMDLSGFEGIATEASEDILNFNPTVIGTETWDGKVCLVVEYTAVFEGVESKIKQWVWKMYGFPIRTESITGGQSAVMECRNIEFGDIPNSMFELPGGVEIMGW